MPEIPFPVTGEPLLFINGELAEGGMEDLDPESVESIEIVKGPAAVARWGERARQGAIFVTLKDGVR